MSNIAKAFASGKAFIPFITCGDPDLVTTEQAVRAMAKAGADLIELGIPFSDPTAEGPVIQAANARALSAGTTTDKIFEMVRHLRQDLTTPLVFMTYANVVFSYGIDRFCAACAEVGVDGLILPDVPYEEKDEFQPECRRYRLDLISLVAPTSEARITAHCQRTPRGFSTWFPAWALPACAVPSPPTSAPWSRRSGKVLLSHALWVRHLHPGAGRAHGCPLAMASSLAAPLLGSWRSMGRGRPLCSGVCPYQKQ